MFSTFLLLPALLAAPVDAADVAESEDGVFEMVLPEDWWLDGDVVRHAKDPFEVRLRDTWPVAPDGYKAQLTAIAKDAEAGATSGSWAGGVRDSRRGACIDTRGTVGFNVRIATWCLVQLDDDHAALLTMHTRNMLHGTTYGSLLQELLPEVYTTGKRPSASPKPVAAPELPEPEPMAAPLVATDWYKKKPDGESTETAATPPASPSSAAPAASPPSSSTSSAPTPVVTAAPAGPSLGALGYVCAQGRWNATSGVDDLRVHWKSDTHELLATFTVLDGIDTVSFSVGGVVDVAPPGTDPQSNQDIRGQLELREGPSSTASGIHRLFQVVDVQGVLDGGQVTAIRTGADESFTGLRPCGAG